MNHLKFRTLFGTLFVLVILAVTAVSPALAQGQNAVSFNGFGFQFDMSLANSVNISQFPGDPPSLEQPGGADVKHTEFGLYTAQPGQLVPSSFDAAGFVRLYRVADIAGYEFPTKELEALKALLANKPDLAQYMEIRQNQTESALPFMPVVPAGQVIRARAQYVQTSALSGVSYITVFRQDVSPFLARDFKYSFQGISADGQYYIATTFQLNATMFPSEYPSDLNPEAFMAKLMEYLTESVATLNKAEPSAFTPSLTTLDAVIQSFTFGK